MRETYQRVYVITAKNDGTGIVKRTIRNCSLKLIKRTLNQVKSSIDEQILFTMFIGRPKISREFKKMAKEFMK